MQTILGAGGAIGRELAKVLPEYTSRVRLVGRNPVKVVQSNELLRADMTVLSEVREAMKGSEVAYLTVGLPYRIKIWQSQWPQIMQNTIRAASEYGTKLVFFDNIYMYDKSNMDPMTENQPVNPPSKKGRVRERIAGDFLEAVAKGEIKGLIARSADFYGPSIKNVSVLTETVFEPLSQGKKANWMGRADKKHSFTYVPDAARATALLGNTDDAYGEVWHLPTAAHPFTGEQWIREIAGALGVPPRYRVAGKAVLRFMGIFSPMMRELAEMAYQYDRHYVFDSSRFQDRFKITPTSYQEGIRQIVAADYAA